MGISSDNYAANKRFAEDIQVTFPLPSDFKRKVVRNYGIFGEESDCGTRAAFTVDKEGVIGASSRVNRRLFERRVSIVQHTKLNKKMLLRRY